VIYPLNQLLEDNTMLGLTRSNLSKGTSIELQGGYFTMESYLTGRTLTEMARIMGIQHFQIQDGAWIIRAIHLPTIENFEPAYTFSIEDSLEEYKKRVVQIWSRQGRSTLVRVLPTIDIGLFPPGPAIPQWLISSSITCEVIAFLEKDDVFSI
jgi:hypothetical protein